MDTYITDKEAQMTNKRTKICLVSLISKIAVRYHFTPISLKNMKKPENMQLVRTMATLIHR